MEQLREENPLGYEKVWKLLRNFAIPSVIAMLVSSLYNVVDQIFIGQGVGYLGNAATNVSFPLTTICMAIALTIGIGSAASFSLSLGRGEENEAADVVGNGVCMAVVFGTAYALIAEIFLPHILRAFGATGEIMPYAMSYVRITVAGMPFLIVQNCMVNLVRADGSPMYSMITMLTGAVINTILDPIFIFVFKMGVAGAAIATVIGQIASFVIAAAYMRRFKRVTLKKSHFKLSLRGIRHTAAMGMSNGLTQVALTLVQIVMNRSLVYYGALSEYGSEIPLASSGIVMKVNSIILAVIIGIVQGIQPIIGFNYGAKKYSRVKKAYRLAVICELVITLTGFALLEIFPEAALRLFGTGNDLYLRFSKMFMRTFLLMLPLNGIQMISSNFFSAIGKPLKGAALSLTRQVFFLIPLLLILPLIWGIHGILAAAPIADFTAFAVVMLFIVREMRDMTRLENGDNM